ncbi:hypothetical protein B0H67DRAFT_554723 [Lasiosphaeris hirsuta]|uniref:Uncharacterized protein n=1 Tax=Lasiosphaeris hirsuta TaxID=260670 RepID=A0AA40A7I2_9PEZI|nr:hypothetical protein B0H67DRAFT_554723 [Lasiosphaeris hirsuta]
MRLFSIATATATTLASSVAAQSSSVIMHVFDSSTCDGFLGGATVIENLCREIDNPLPVFGSFRFVPGSLNLAPGCRVVFNNDNTCSPLRDGVAIDVNDSQCFRADDPGIFRARFATVFCS